MKKILLLFALTGLFTVTSCSDDDNYDRNFDADTIAEVFEVTNVNFIASGDYQITIPLNPSIGNADMVLLYRESGAEQNGAYIWEPIPTRYYLDEGQLDYFFDFSVNNIVAYLQADFNPSLRPDFSLNQVLRVVIIPGYLSGKSSSKAQVDFTDYNAVAKAYNLTDKNIKEVKLK